VKLRPGAKVISSFCYGDDVPEFGDYKASFADDEPKENFPSCYLYENADGERFAVYTFVALNVQNRNIYDGFNGDFFVNYCRQRQIFECAEWLGKKRMPAKSLKNPYLYVLCAEDENSRTVGLWNLWEDEILHPEIEIDLAPRSIEFYRTKGYADGTTVHLTEPIRPYDCAIITLKKR
jgi:hypothetical protein